MTLRASQEIDEMLHSNTPALVVPFGLDLRGKHQLVVSLSSSAPQPPPEIAEYCRYCSTCVGILTGSI